MSEDRLHPLREKVESAECDALLSLGAADNQYLTGFLTSLQGRSSAVIVTSDEALFLCDFRYTEQAREQVTGFRVEQIQGGGLASAGGTRLAGLGARRIAFDPSGLTVDELRQVQSVCDASFEPISGVVADLRRVKTAAEAQRIRAASRLAEGVLSDLLGSLTPGMPERELAAQFDYEFKRRGASGPAFDTTCLFGPRSSLPHGESGDKRLEFGDIVLLDLGCRLSGYCSDLTRTYAFGTMPGAWFEEVYELVRTAQALALEAVRPGLRGRELDAAARGLINDAGYGEHFGHGLGHGVGIEIHEGPRLSARSETVLEPGMVVTVEPGVYLPGRGGVRIEDLVLVVESGCEVITAAPKNLQVIGA